MNSDIAIRRATQTESSATVLVERVAGAGQPPAGVVRGPQCARARTLPAEFALQSLPEAPGRSPAAAAVVVDPCYWTPELPFQYELRLGDATPPQQIALRRWYAVGDSFQLSGRRTVLRGVAPSPAALMRQPSELLEAARLNGATLLAAPTDELCRQASHCGVGLIVDLRAQQRLSSAGVHALAAEGSVLLAVVAAPQLTTHGAALRKAGLLVAAAMRATDPLVAGADLDMFDAVAVELQPGELPPAHLADSSRPVIAIRRGGTASDLAAARQAADHLQAELAPQFNLAGYLVETHP